MPDRLRELWDFEDLDATTERFTGQLERESDDVGRAEVLTQLARVAGLRGDVGTALMRLDEASVLAGPDRRVEARIALERGRALRSAADGGDEDAARTSFGTAFDLAVEVDDAWLAADAAHMLAIVAVNQADREAWTDRGVEVAEASSDPADAYWVGPLMNNLGWSRLDDGDAEGALSAFEHALEVRDRDPAHPYEAEIARYAVAKALLALGRAAEAVPPLERAAAWADDADTPDGYFHEALAEAYGATGRRSDAAAQARRALELLPAQDPSFADDADRADRLRAVDDAP